MHFHWSLIPTLILSWVWLYRAYHGIHTILNTPTLSPSPEKRRESQPPISILIPARNEEKNIGICIRSLLTQIGPRDQIIVINDRSTDGTESVLKSLGAELLNRTLSPAQKELLNLVYGAYRR